MQRGSIGRRERRRREQLAHAPNDHAGSGRLGSGWVALAGLVLVLWAGPSPGAVFTVTSTGDGPPGLCLVSSCTLREAIATANVLPGPDEIRLPAGLYQLSEGGINEDQALTGDLDVTDDLVVFGASTASTVIDGDEIDRIFDVHDGARLMLSQMSLLSGRAISGGGGGGVRSSGEVVLDGVFLALNESTSLGGAVLSYGPLEIRRSTLFNNDAVRGGGVHAEAGPLRIIESTVSSNSASNDGGGLYTLEPFAITILRSTFSGNSANNGGGAMMIWNGAAAPDNTFLMRNSTISGNSSMAQVVPGADIYLTNNVQAAFQANTLVSDSEFIYGSYFNAASAWVGNIAVGACDDDAAGAVFVSGNIGVDASCGFLFPPGLVTEAEIDLQPLGTNGGFGSTHALGDGSVAIDYPNPEGCPVQDQRALMRGASCDAGAYEWQAVVPAAIFEGDFETGDATSWSATSP